VELSRVVQEPCSATTKAHETYAHATSGAGDLKTVRYASNCMCGPYGTCAGIRFFVSIDVNKCVAVHVLSVRLPMVANTHMKYKLSSLP